MSTIVSTDAMLASPFARSSDRQADGDFSSELDRPDPADDARAERAATRARPLPKPVDALPPGVRGNAASEPRVTEPADASGIPQESPSLPESTIALVNQIVQPVSLMGQLLASRVYGEHLLGGGYLSVMSTAEADEQAATTAHGVVAAETSFEAVDRVASPAAVVAEAQDAVGTSVTELFAATTQTPGGTDIDWNEATSASDRSSMFAAVARSWPDHLLRAIGQPDGSCVVWLRDFRLGDADADAQVAALVHEAHSQGTRLSRIILNGREVWSSPTETVKGE
jgi:hypothetical protein